MQHGTSKEEEEEKEEYLYHSLVVHADGMYVHSGELSLNLDIK